MSPKLKSFLIGLLVATTAVSIARVPGWRPMRDIVANELPEFDLPRGPSNTAAVTDEDLATLPPAAQRYFRFMRVVGRPRDWSFRATFHGRFRPKADGEWLELSAIQYNTAPRIARLFYMRLPFFGFTVQGRDFYLAGKGSMIIRPLDLFTVENAGGEPFDLGELVTWLNDAVNFAPSMLLIPEVEFKAVDEQSFDVALSDHGHRVSARVFVDSQGAPTNFHTEDRWYSPPGSKAAPVRTPWETPVSGYHLVDDRMLPSFGQAVWKRPEGDLPYAEFRIGAGDIRYNVAAATK